MPKDLYHNHAINMEHTKKMVVIPQDLMENLRYNQQKKVGREGKRELDIDREMKHILARDDLDLKDKVRLYNSTLTKFGETKPEKEKVQELMVEEPEQEDEWVDMIDRHFALTNKLKAKHMLEWIRNKGSITWDDKGVVKGLPGSNILTLLDDITRQQPRHKTVIPVGMEAFASKLTDSNVPRYLVSPFYQKYFGPTVEDDDDEEEDVFSSPIGKRTRSGKSDSPVVKSTPRRPRKLVSDKVKRIATPPVSSATATPVLPQALPPSPPQEEWLLPEFN